MSTVTQAIAGAAVEVDDAKAVLAKAQLERDLLIRQYGDAYTRRELAEITGLTPGRIQQILEKP